MATPKRSPNGKSWRIQLEVFGTRESGTFPTKREAEDWKARRTLELRAIGGGNAGSVKTLGDAFMRYADEVSPTKRGESKEIIRLQAFARHPAMPVKRKLSELTTADLAAWRDARLKVNARGSVLRDMTLLSSVLEQARREWGWVSVNVMREVRRPAEPDHRERLISWQETRAMLRQLGWQPRGSVRTVSQAVAGCFLLALRTGMRAGELCGLTWSTVQADHVLLATGSTKSGKARAVPLSHGAQALIARMRGWDDVSVFGLTSQTLDALFRKARTRAGLAGFTFHDSRHTAATTLAMRVHVLELCKIFGWARTDQALTYFNPSASDLAARLSSRR